MPIHIPFIHTFQVKSCLTINSINQELPSFLKSLNRVYSIFHNKLFTLNLKQELKGKSRENKKVVK